MRFITLLVSLLILLSTNIVLGQKKGIIIIDSLSNVPVQFAIVQSQDLKFSQIADENGFVNLAKMPKQTSSILISSIAFETKTIKLSDYNFNTYTPKIYLIPSVSTLKEITIKATTNNGVFKIISDLDIHLRPVNNSQEVLRMVPGLFIGQHAGGGKAEQIFLRGFDIDHGTDINLTVDGMPVNMVSHAHGQGYADIHFVIPEFIEKVNFNKGPYFADKGNFTTAGFVEFKTKDYLEQDFTKLEVGKFGTFRGVTGINLLKKTKKQKNQSLYIAAEGSITKGYFDNSQDFSRINTTLKYHGELSKSTSLSATLTGFTSKWNASGQIPERAIKNQLIGYYGAIDPTEGGKTARYNANLEVLTNLKNNGTIRNQFFYSKYMFELYSNFTFFKTDSINGDQIKQKENRDIWGYNSVFQKALTIGKFKTESKIGVQIRYDNVNDLALTQTKNKLIETRQISVGDVNELNVGVYTSQNVSLNDNLNVTLAIRLDYFKNRYFNKIDNSDLSVNAIIASPKLNFDYQLNTKTKLYWYNGRGFHSNDTRVAVPQNGKKVLPPAYGSDIGVVFKLSNKLLLQSAIWYLWLDQEFVYVGDEGIVEPGGKTKRFGFDISARYEFLKNIYADIDISLANPRALNVDKNQNYIPLAPRFTSVGGLTYKKLSGWNGSLRYRYMADRPANESNSVIAQGYFVTDATLNYLTKKWEAGIQIQNLFDTKWKETQFETESRLKNEAEAISEIHFTPGTPFFARLNFTLFF